jgi:hypothetical protein
MATPDVENGDHPVLSKISRWDNLKVIEMLLVK